MRCSGIEEADSDAGQQAGTVFPLVKEGKQVPAKRLSMRKIKEVLRLKFELGFGHRQIARGCGIDKSYLNLRSLVRTPTDQRRERTRATKGLSTLWYLRVSS